MVNINIPLPDSCVSCPLSVRHFGKLYCPPLNDRVGNEGKDSRCPLVDAEGRGDLIDRQDALSCFYDWIDQRGDVHTADEMPEYQRIEELPSAQPERPAQPESAREYCAECDHIEMCRWYPYEGCEFRSLPSAQPEIIRCKGCENWDTSWQNDYAPNYHYCPLVDGARRDDFYCADAERRTDE